MNGKFVALTKNQLWEKVKCSGFNDLFKSQPKKASLLFNDLWNSMTPTPNSLNKRYLFESVFIRWMYEVEGELK